MQIKLVTWDQMCLWLRIQNLMKVTENYGSENKSIRLGDSQL